MTTPPDFIWLHLTELRPEMSLPASKWVDPSKAVALVRRDLAVLAALPEVKALIAAETERCAKIADERAAKHEAELAQEWPKSAHANRLKARYSEDVTIAAAIREGRKDG